MWSGGSRLGVNLDNLRIGNRHGSLVKSGSIGMIFSRLFSCCRSGSLNALTLCAEITSSVRYIEQFPLAKKNKKIKESLLLQLRKIFQNPIFL
jgi:hypothetical protein